MMLNNDMIAFESSSDPYSWMVNIMDYESSVSLRLKAQQLCEKYTTLQSYNDNENNERSDSYPYSTFGFPALFFFKHAYDPTYHTLDDISSNCNFEYCREVVNVSVSLLVHKD
jgi:hypothetical protein